MWVWALVPRCNEKAICTPNETALCKPVRFESFCNDSYSNNLLWSKMAKKQHRLYAIASSFALIDTWIDVLTQIIVVSIFGFICINFKIQTMMMMMFLRLFFHAFSLSFLRQFSHSRRDRQWTFEKLHIIHRRVRLPIFTRSIQLAVTCICSQVCNR